MKLNAAGVGIRIKQARVAKGWTQTELAKQLDVQRSSVVRWESGISVPQCVPKIAALLGQPAAWFMDRADEISADISNSREVDTLQKEVRRLHKLLNSKFENRNNSAPTAPPVPKALELAGKNPEDESALEDVLGAWNRANSEARYMAALLITGDWSYKLKLWNLNISVGDEMLQAIGNAHRNRHREA
jgi:transcriptional regulator with XRE-family HTH domain